MPVVMLTAMLAVGQAVGVDIGERTWEEDLQIWGGAQMEGGMRSLEPSAVSEATVAMLIEAARAINACQTKQHFRPEASQQMD